MPRRPRLFVPGAIYHVYCRVARGEFVFDEHDEAVEFIEVLRKVRDLDRLTIFAWCLMGNHYHLVLKTGEIALWRSMARLQGSFSRGHNRRHRYLGRLWQSRYRARVIDTDEYFRQAVAYVHLNPVSARMVDDPAAYVFSGHREIIGACSPHIIDRRAVLYGFDEPVATSPAENYLHWVRGVAEARWAPEPTAELPWWAGSTDEDEIADRHRHPAARRFDGLELAEERLGLTLDELVDRLKGLDLVPVERLSSRSRGAELTLLRVEFAALAIGRYQARTCDVAALLDKHPNSITKWLNRGLRLERQDPAFKRRIDTLDEAVSRRD
ncbi:MAG TPA: transposase [Candidatus Sulfomarinibacteraceae bacterium]|nr:transposase [Candidatus Sulfomarinibacteraceae bacterium]